ncbi:class I SAM-dependent methyltransferase [Leeuwenhoekiella sp. NPDC079379]|uniref:class I SAM-dependent methyltransferase n=1 Tax=Leeuwenhoekiella sp. NPDC079379 TaxID=3364122 RepID=UPI0037C54C1D
MHCLLCNHSADFLGSFQNRNYNRCTYCASVFLDTCDLPTYIKEKERYDKHENTSDNSGYLNFLKPLLNAVSKDQNKEKKGLDFGSGPNPVLTSYLQENGYQIKPYDPFYSNDISLLDYTYDYIICCEVIEHFHNPNLEFTKIRALLNPDGKLYCKTNMLSDSINFENWWYKNDFTHTFFYTEKALRFIKDKFGFEELNIFKEYFIFKA